MSDNYSIENQNTDGVSETYSIPNTGNSDTTVYTIDVSEESVSASQTEGNSAITQTMQLVNEANVYIKISNITVENGFLMFYFDNGLIFNCGRVKGDKILLKKSIDGLLYKYEGEEDTAYQILIPRNEYAFHYTDFTAEELENLKTPLINVVNAIKSGVMINGELNITLE